MAAGNSLLPAFFARGETFGAWNGRFWNANETIGRLTLQICTKPAHWLTRHGSVSIEKYFRNNPVILSRSLDMVVAFTYNI
jgi:hypothetical protein